MTDAPDDMAKFPENLRDMSTPELIAELVKEARIDALQEAENAAKAVSKAAGRAAEMAVEQRSSNVIVVGTATYQNGAEAVLEAIQAIIAKDMI